jgi:hypothetical protein
MCTIIILIPFSFLNHENDGQQEASFILFRFLQVIKDVISQTKENNIGDI